MIFKHWFIGSCCIEFCRKLAKYPDIITMIIISLFPRERKTTEKIIYLSSFYVLCCCLQVLSHPRPPIESFTIHYLEDRRIVTVKVEINSEDQTERVSSIGRETLYDFKRGKLAYKDINSSQCFIGNIAGETLEGDRRRLRNLQNGVVRDFYLPTFTIREELSTNTANLKSFGSLLDVFCDGNHVSLLERHVVRRKRETGKKGQFTHHSYGHYGHQTNNYAHYGHETYVTGSVDGDGRPRNHEVGQSQVRSVGSHAYPSRPDFRDGEISTTRSESSRVYPRSGFKDGQISTGDSIAGIPSSQTQTQYRVPSHQQSFENGGKNVGVGGSGQFSLQTAHEGGYQLNLPLGLRSGNAYRGGVRSSGHYGVGGSQPQLTTDFRKYPDSIHPSDFQQPGRLSQQLPPISTLPGVPHRQVGVTPSDFQRPGHLSQPLPPISTSPGVPHRQVGVTPTRPFLPGYHDTGVSQTRQGTGVETIPSHIRPEVSAPGMPSGIPAVSSVPRAHGIHDLPTDLRTHIPGQQFIQTRTDYPAIPGSSISTPGSYVPQEHTQFTQTQERAPQRHGDLPRHVSTEIPGSQSTGTHFYPGPSIHRLEHQIPIRQPGINLPSISTSGRDTTLDQTGAQPIGSRAIGAQPSMRLPPLSHQIPGLDSDLRQQQHLSSIDQRYQKAPHTRYPSGQDGIIGMRPGIPASYPSSYPPALTSMDGQGIPHSLTVPGLSPYLTPAGAVRGDTRYSNGLSPRDRVRGDISSRTSGISRETGGTPTTAVGSEDAQYGGIRPPETIGGYQTPDEVRRNGRIPDSLYDSRGIDTSARDGRTAQAGSEALRGFGRENVQYRGTGSISPEPIGGYQTPDIGRQDRRVPDSLYDSRGIVPDSSAQDGRRIISRGTGSEALRAFDQDSASSQTQIQTGQEGTAAEASAAGQHGGLGSQTQVQGGYVGNGSFSAQAQSGFVGGVVQSQVQGSKQGGLSGSSAQVERVGAAQSQVQVGQPSGAASSTAQGKFTGGSTQVQAQGGKTGGSAGAQSQSTGLSSSHVQVNIGGKDASDQEHFQGTVSASVQGGHSSGQSQTQLQGGYKSGRSYVATAQGGFDSTSGFEASLPVVGSLRIPNKTSIARYPFTDTRGQESLGITNGRQLRAGSTGFGQPTTNDLSINGQILKAVPRGQPSGQESFAQPDQSPTLLDTRRLPNGQHQQPFPSPGSLRQQTSIPSQAQYPSSVQEAQRQSHLPPASHFTSARQYPGYPTDLTETATRTRLPAEHDFTTYRGNGQRQTLPFGSQQINGLGIQRPFSESLPTATGPRVQGSLYGPEIRQPTSTGDLSYPPSVISPFQYPTNQKSNDTDGALVPPSHRMQTHDSRYIPTYPTGVKPQIPSFQSEFHPPPTFLPQNLMPSSQIMPQGRQTDELPVFTRQDALQTGIRPSQIFPSQPQISMPSSQIIPSGQRFDGMAGLARPDINTDRSPQGQPEQSLITPLSPQGRLEPTNGSLKPQIFPVTTRVSAPSIATDIMHRPGVSQTRDFRPGVSEETRGFGPGVPEETRGFRPGASETRSFRPGVPEETRDFRPGVPEETRGFRPGVSEPDQRNCCEALRNLKQRCCGRSSADRAACCKSSQDDLFDFSSENLDESKEPCKVVKAICYIVYKPVGKARVCKPTSSNQC